MIYHLFDDDKLDLNLTFTTKQLDDFLDMWEDGISVENIAKKLKRKPSEIALLVFDHAERGLIEARETGVYGL